jgi:cephalosporin hydroxylase
VSVEVKALSVTDAFHVQEYEAGAKGRSWGAARYFGCKIWKLPSDLMTYSEIICEIKPALIIETGTAFGGSALFFAHHLDQLSHGRVLSIDIELMQPSWPRHHRIDYWAGLSSTEIDISALREQVGMAGEPCMVVLDSNHAAKHVLAELAMYAPLVSGGSYLVVEDTNLNGHPIPSDWIGPPENHGPGPSDALREWLPKHPDFKIDVARSEKFGYSYHTWLRRMRT